MKKMVISVIAFAILVVGCGQTHSSASWPFALVNWNQHMYKVTADSVNNVGNVVGSVTNYSNIEAASHTGTFSNKFPIGTKLYEIPGTSTNIAIAVQISDGSFLKAVYQDVDTPPSNSTVH